MTEQGRKYYLVFAAQAVTVQSTSPTQIGNRVYEYQHRPTGELAWASTPVGMFYADSPDQACKAAARKVGTMGVYFAVEGTPWGVAMTESGAEEVGLNFNVAPQLEG